MIEKVAAAAELVRMGRAAVGCVVVVAADAGENVAARFAGPADAVELAAEFAAVELVPAEIAVAQPADALPAAVAGLVVEKHANVAAKLPLDEQLASGLFPAVMAT